MRGAYVFDRTLAAADPDGRARLLDGLAATGLTTLITKADAATPALSAACHAAGLRLVGSVACLSDHAEPAERRRPDLRPVSGDGRPWQQREWYTGLVPTDPVHGERLAERCAGAAAGAVARAVRAEAGGSPGTAVVPMVQTTSSAALARGADWGPPVTTAGFRAALHHALDASAGGDLCLFPGEGLDGPGRRALTDALA
ncbi:hypothetical protein [Streptomyces sp. BE303]|uniref:hypothetical protein n=1 Tax=Streptomyces sp. BE303 TaxID=3002528 RepID=UPI002E772B0C|nr:hypothetical protein [Streptomyces sp. BE303]MED7953804.1 hypothetical protein [Streptomyces sp. BE303]